MSHSEASAILPPDFLVVGLGASAGGIEALQTFFTHVPADSGMAYVVILHLSPDHDSQLAAIVRAVTPLAVTRVSEAVRVEPNHVYVVPPNQHLQMVDGTLAVSPNTQAEGINRASALFVAVSREHHIFQSQRSGPRAFPVPEAVPIGRAEQRRIDPPRLAPAARQPGEHVSYGELHQRLLEQYAPPSVVINHNYDIVHLSERAGRYLQVAGGEPSTSLLSLVRPELRPALRSALYQATQQQINVDGASLPVRIDNHTETITIRVRPVPHEGDGAQRFLLVLFVPSSEAPSDEATVLRSAEPAARQLEDEVQRLRQQLRTSSEQYEFQAEELKATNEELQALNEELRSSTEELETSKEELQSSNEELRTVNQELKVKVEEATLHSTNMQNLVNSTDIGTIFLDRTFRIRLFTPATRALFNLIPADYGRPLSDITHRLLDADVLTDAERVLATLQPVEREVRTSDGQVYVLRLLPYRAAEDRIGGVVLTFFDITERKRKDEALWASEERHTFLLKLSDALRSLSDPVAIQETVTRTAMDYFGADRCYYCELEDGNAIIRRDAFRGNLPSVAGVYPLSSFALLKAVVDAGRPFVVYDVHTTNTVDEELRRLCIELQVISYVNVPIIKNGKPAGVLCLVQSTQRNWTELEVELAAETAERTWMAVERARAEQALARSEE